MTDTKGKDIVNSAWFVGFTRQISTAVMYVAGDGGNASLDDYARPGDSTFFGGTYPALTWADYMETATKGQSVKEFDPPAYVNRDKVPEPTATSRPEPSDEPTRKPTETSEPTNDQHAQPDADRITRTDRDGQRAAQAGTDSHQVEGGGGPGGGGETPRTGGG